MGSLLVTLDFFPTFLDTLSPPSGHQQSDDFCDTDTLAELLVQLGHRCRGECPDEQYPLTGLICVVPCGHISGSVAVVLMDITQRPGPLAETCRVLRAINNCVRHDHIRVVHGDRGR